MKLVIQRVTRASVTADGELSGQIGPGLVLLLGVEHGDTLDQALQLATKVLKIRLWADLKDPNKHWVTSVVDRGYDLLVVSQFTLFATFKKPKPDFQQAMGGEEARLLYEAFVEHCRKGLGEARVATGVFGAMMQVELCNDGPVTVELVAGAAGAASSGGAESSPQSSQAGAASAPTPAPRAAAAGGSGQRGSGRQGDFAAEEALLLWQPYLGGFVPSRADVALLERLAAAGRTEGSPNLARWLEHVSSFSKLQRSQWP